MRRVSLFVAFAGLLFAQDPTGMNRRPAGSSSAGPQTPVPEQPQEPGSLEGAVLSAATGEPVKKANLVLMRADPAAGMRMPLLASSDSGGQFGFRDVPPGNYRLTVERAGFVRMAYGARSSMRSGTILSIRPGQKVTGIAFKLTPQAVITGRVMDEDGEPVMNVSVQALRYAFLQGKRRLMPAGNSMTNDLGEYRLFSLPPGKYLLSATYRAMYGMGAVSRAGSSPNEPEEGYTPTYYPGTNDPASAAPVEATAGNALRGVDIRLLKTRTMRIRGRVLNTITNRPARQTSVMLVPRESSYLGIDRNAAGVQPDGRFELRGIAAGSYILMANYWEDGRTYFARQPIEVTTSNVDSVTLSIGPGIDVPGTIKVEGSGTVSLESLHVAAQPRDAQVFGGGGGAVKEDGSFTLQNLGPDVYDFNLFGGTGDAYLKSARMGDQDALAAGLDLSSGVAAALEVVLSTNGGHVEGSVVDSKGNPATSATVVLIPDSDRRKQMHLYKNANTDQYGHFTLGGIAPGEYKLYAWEDIDFGAWQDPEFLKPFESKGESVSVHEGGREAKQLKMIPADDTQTAAAGSSQ